MIKMKRCVSNLETNYFIINMSSSRSIAAARNRRSGDAPPNVQSQQRPVTSISSQAAFNQPQQYARSSNQNQNQNQNQKQQPNQKQQSSNQKQQPQDNTGKPSNGLPFSKLSISDAIGLVTLRLGRVEQFMIDIHEQGVPSVSDNKMVIDNSVLTTIVSRLDSLEKKEHSSANNEKLVYLENEVISLKNIIVKLTNDVHMFIQNTTEKFIDFEEAFIELEKSIVTNDQALSEDQIPILEENAEDVTSNINMMIQDEPVAESSEIEESYNE